MGLNASHLYVISDYVQQIGTKNNNIIIIKNNKKNFQINIA